LGICSVIVLTVLGEAKMSADAIGIAGAVCFAIFLAVRAIVDEVRRQGEATRETLEPMVQRLRSIDERGHRDEIDR
jgi:hypothetical protein